MKNQYQLEQLALTLCKYTCDIHVYTPESSSTHYHPAKNLQILHKHESISTALKGLFSYYTLEHRQVKVALSHKVRPMAEPRNESPARPHCQEELSFSTFEYYLHVRAAAYPVARTPKPCQLNHKEISGES